MESDMRELRPVISGHHHHQIICAFTCYIDLIVKHEVANLGSPKMCLVLSAEDMEQH